MIPQGFQRDRATARNPSATLDVLRGATPATPRPVSTQMRDATVDAAAVHLEQTCCFRDITSGLLKGTLDEHQLGILKVQR